jgi:nucleoid DNA-binding protein
MAGREEVQEEAAQVAARARQAIGTFERKRRNRRIARNPRMPATPIVVPARDLPWFIPGTEFKEMVARRRRTATRSTRRR